VRTRGRGIEDRAGGENPHVGWADGWCRVLFVGHGPQEGWLVHCRVERNGCSGEVRGGGYDLWEAAHCWGGAPLRVRLGQIMLGWVRLYIVCLDS
jgi:hypothetical protein